MNYDLIANEQTNEYINVIATLVFICINIFTLWMYWTFITGLEQNCHCSTDWKRDYIKFFIKYAILTTVIINIFALLNHDMVNNSLSVDIISLLYSLIIIPLPFIVFYYFNQLENSGCTCAVGWKKTGIQIVSGLQIFVYFMAVLSFV